MSFVKLLLCLYPAFYKVIFAILVKLSTIVFCIFSNFHHFEFSSLHLEMYGFGKGVFLFLLWPTHSSPSRRQSIAEFNKEYKAYGWKLDGDGNPLLAEAARVRRDVHCLTVINRFLFN